MRDGAVDFVPEFCGLVPPLLVLVGRSRHLEGRVFELRQDACSAIFVDVKVQQAERRRGRRSQRIRGGDARRDNIEWCVRLEGLRAHDHGLLLPAPLPRLQPEGGVCIAELPLFRVGAFDHLLQEQLDLGRPERFRLDADTKGERAHRGGSAVDAAVVE